MANCGVTGVVDEDVWETDINLYAGACYFRAQLESHNNDAFAAIVAYNQGPNAKDVKSYVKSGRVNEKEALQYISSFGYLTRKVTTEVTSAAPALKDLPAIGKSVKLDAKVATPAINVGNANAQSQLDILKKVK
jgi:hypothetical protein